ncbi:MAG: tyrosine-type recombinase/integrase [Anaerolineae bacterium]|nr:tyrosine-type recombinase/integrase [Anaerolineae bacterium]
MNIQNAMDAYLNLINSSRSANTARTYGNALKYFTSVLSAHNVMIDDAQVNDLSLDSINWMIQSLRVYSSTTERLYLTAISGFFEFLTAENLIEINLTRLKMIIRQRSRRPAIRLPQFPQDAIELVLTYAQSIPEHSITNPQEKLRALRDRAFLITLADTGLRVHEICNLRRGDIDWFEGRAQIVGKGNRQAIVRFSHRCQQAIQDYHKARAELDGQSGKPLGALPVFARHDRGAGKKVKPITTTTGRNIVNQRVEEALGQDNATAITPHSFRHYFVTRVLQTSDNLKLAQELARHQNIAVTQRYAHLSDKQLDEGYRSIFEA